MTANSPTTQRRARELGEHVRTWRKLQNLRMDDLAERANVSRGVVHRIESGNLGVSLGSLLEVLRCLGQLDVLVEALDPYESDLGRMRADAHLPERVR